MCICPLLLLHLPLLLRRLEGAGLQTGDASLNIEAPVVVMTTEILRNMLYRADGPEGEADGNGRTGANQDRLKVSWRPQVAGGVRMVVGVRRAFRGDWCS